MNTSDTIYTFKRVFVVILLLSSFASANFRGHFIRQPSVCVPIPSDLKLCRDVAYNKMILPNLFNHESMDEVRQQASSFVPLLNKGCHRHLQEFLCSLFAPVCLPPGSPVTGPIPPCRSLCLSVKASCFPVLKEWEFDWPPMLNCSQFTEIEPCVNLNNSEDPPPSPDPTETNTCAPCRTELDSNMLHDNYCASEFVLKMKIRRVREKKSKGIREIIADKKKRVIYKLGPLTKRDVRKLKLVVKGSKKCVCPPLDDVPSLSTKSKKKGKKNRMFYLVMGRKVDRKLLVTVLHSWAKKNKVLKQASRTHFGATQCPEFGPTIIQ